MSNQHFNIFFLFFFYCPVIWMLFEWDWSNVIKGRLYVNEQCLRCALCNGHASGSNRNEFICKMIARLSFNTIKWWKKKKEISAFVYGYTKRWSEHLHKSQSDFVKLKLESITCNNIAHAQWRRQSEHITTKKKTVLFIPTL